MLAAANGAKRILELSATLGYTELWLEHGTTMTHVDTLERDMQHVSLARTSIASLVFSSRIIVHEGEFAKFLPTLSPGCDLAFFDGYAPALLEISGLRRLPQLSGLLVSANQRLARPETADYRTQLLDPKHCFSFSLGDDSEMTLSVRVPTPY